jgi:glycosyltransferase involved in cell wall biosynthesis
VVDVFDNPLQYAFNNPRSHHRVTARLLLRLADRADGGVHNYHYSGPVLGDDSRFITEGYPTALIEPDFDPPETELHCIWAGSPRLDRGIKILFEALAKLDDFVTVDIYGNASEDVLNLAQYYEVSEQATFHGQMPHSEVCDQIGRFHAGLCVLPERQDWLHSAPLKVREYMAGGTVPICSNFPGMRLTAESAAIYTEPTADALAATLDRLFEISYNNPDRYIKKMRAVRERAEGRSLDTAGEWFVRQCLSSGLDIELF